LNSATIVNMFVVVTRCYLKVKVIFIIGSRVRALLHS